MGVIFPIPFPLYSRAVLLEAINEGHDARGEALVNYIMEAFARVDPSTRANFRKWLQQRVAIACGDGAMAQGGEDRNQRSLCLNLLAVDWASWDVFHLIDKAGSQALKNSSTAAAFFILLKTIEKLFGRVAGTAFPRLS